jgi:hypothetical protein
MNHGFKVVEDHLLAVVSRPPTSREHLLGDSPGRAGSFQLTRRDGLLSKRTDQVSIAGSKIRDDVIRDDPATRLLVDAMDHFLDWIHVAEVEEGAVDSSKRELS